MTIYALLCFTCHDSKQYVLYRLFSALPPPLLLFGLIHHQNFLYTCVNTTFKNRKSSQWFTRRNYRNSIVFKENRNSVENIQMPKNRQKKKKKEHLVILMSCYVKRALKKCQKSIFWNLSKLVLVIFSKDYNYGVHTVFENLRKSLIQHFERSELRLHSEWTKIN